MLLLNNNGGKQWVSFSKRFSLNSRKKNEGGENTYGRFTYSQTSRLSINQLQLSRDEEKRFYHVLKRLAWERDRKTFPRYQTASTPRTVISVIVIPVWFSYLLFYYLKKGFHHSNLLFTSGAMDSGNPTWMIKAKIQSSFMNSRRKHLRQNIWR